MPFIDFLLTLVVFLLSTFEASGVPGVTLDLPDAHHGADVVFAPTVVIDARAITLEGYRVADTATLRESRAVERTDALVRGLEAQRSSWALLHPGQSFPAAIVIQADRSIDFRVIRHVMFSAAQAGYSNLRFAVNRA